MKWPTFAISVESQALFIHQSIQREGERERERERDLRRWPCRHAYAFGVYVCFLLSLALTLRFVYPECCSFTALYCACGRLVVLCYLWRYWLFNSEEGCKKNNKPNFLAGKNFLNQNNMANPGGCFSVKS